MKRSTPTRRTARSLRGHSPKYKLDSLAPMLKLRSRAALTLDGRDFGRMEDLAEHIATKRGVSRRTLWVWYRKFNRERRDELKPRGRSDRGTSRILAQHRAAEFFFLYKFLNQKLSAKAAHGALVESWEQLHSFVVGCRSSETTRKCLRQAEKRKRAAARNPDEEGR